MGRRRDQRGERAAGHRTVACAGVAAGRRGGSGGGDGAPDAWEEMRMAVTLRISAASRIDWPQCCPCCLGPAAASMELVSTRVEGVRVIRTNSKSWVVPYCNRCLAHI